MPRLIALHSDLAMYTAAAIVFLAGFLLVHRTIHSPFGNVLKAIRENEQRTISLGYMTERYKLAAFVLSAALAGVAGGLKSIGFGIATLNDVHFSLSGFVVLITLVGGMGRCSDPFSAPSLAPPSTTTWPSSVHGSRLHRVPSLRPVCLCSGVASWARSTTA